MRGVGSGAKRVHLVPTWHEKHRIKRDTGRFLLVRFLCRLKKMNNNNYNLCINYAIRISHWIRKTSPGPPPEVEGLDRLSPSMAPSKPGVSERMRTGIFHLTYRPFVIHNRYRVGTVPFQYPKKVPIRC